MTKGLEVCGGASTGVRGSAGSWGCDSCGYGGDCGYEVRYLTNYIGLQQQGSGYSLSYM